MLLAPPEDLPRPGVEPVSPAWAGRFFTTEPPGMPRYHQNPEFWATVLSGLCCVNRILFSSVCLLWQRSWNYNENFKDWIFYFNMVYWVMFYLKGAKLSTIKVFFVCWSFWVENIQDPKVQEEALTSPTNYLRVFTGPTPGRELLPWGAAGSTTCVGTEEPTKVSLSKFLYPAVSANPANIIYKHLLFHLMSIPSYPLKSQNTVLDTFFVLSRRQY